MSYALWNDASASANWPAWNCVRPCSVRLPRALGVVPGLVPGPPAARLAGGVGRPGASQEESR